MTRQHIHADTVAHSPPAEPTPRLRLKTNPAKTGYVDGAWWPYSDDLAAELPLMLAALTIQLGPVHRVTYNLAEWDTAPGDLVIDGQTTQLDGHPHHTVHTIEVLDTFDRRLVLLVIPPNTDADHAFTVMVSASATDNTATVDHLLAIRPSARSARTKSAAAQQRWNAACTTSTRTTSSV
ncbi:DUF5994 family protein [Nocardia sp. BMG51109]|uniref:DUF5994 family protein n=1 Tax=Nocardia sp. BMG51109 TaxID=1056816 RepID=UPI000464866F|nr:DUF5994 family protein [Nocardia sp. BMG51109]